MGKNDLVKKDDFSLAKSQHEALAAFAPQDEAGNRITIGELFKAGYESEQFIPLGVPGQEGRVSELHAVFIGEGVKLEKTDEHGEVQTMRTWRFHAIGNPANAAVIVGSYKINQRLMTAKKGDTVFIVRLGQIPIGKYRVNDDHVLIRRNGKDVIDTTESK